MDQSIICSEKKIDELLKDSCTELASINEIVDSLSKHGLKNDIEIIVAIDSSINKQLIVDGGLIIIVSLYDSLPSRQKYNFIQ